MENGLNTNPMGTQGSIVVKTSTNDLMLRRMKNRERQRRYRARKRLQADNLKSQIPIQSTIPQLEWQPNVVTNNGIRRVLCKRNWKKDARRAHERKVQEESPNLAAQPINSVVAEGQTPGYMVEGIEGIPGREAPSENSPNVVGFEITKTKVGKRDWKAEARKKKV